MNCIALEVPKVSAPDKQARLDILRFDRDCPSHIGLCNHSRRCSSAHPPAARLHNHLRLADASCTKKCNQRSLRQFSWCSSVSLNFCSQRLARTTLCHSDNYPREDFTTSAFCCCCCCYRRGTVQPLKCDLWSL